VIPAEFEYDRPATVAEAVAILAKNPGSAKVLAGGQSLLGLMRLRLARPERLVDIGRLDELRGIRALPDGGLAIGALVTYREVLDSALATSRVPLLAMAIADIGDVQVRNRGTVVGSIAHADPASDMPAVVLALEAEIVARSSSGERVVPATAFFEGAFVTDLAEDELLTEIRIPAQAAGVGMAYRRFEQPASGYSIAAAAAVVGRTGATVSTVRVGVTGVGDVAYRASAVEAALSGTNGDAAAIAAAAAHAVDGVTVGSDIHADAVYRAEMARVHVRRAIEAALGAAD
jgi:aerobic carbon-monoxide dehydrogenase medium subunit